MRFSSLAYCCIVIAIGMFGDSSRAQPAATTAPSVAARRVPPRQAVVLKEPADWRFEGFVVPPPFAPGIKLTGIEEARFSPGMYDTKSKMYFSYAVVITADGTPELGAAELKDFLEQYFRGLSAAVGRRKGISPKAEDMIATVTPSGDAAARAFEAKMGFVDSFTDGRHVTLNIEIQVLPRAAAMNTYVVLLISPSERDSATWKTLREIGKKAAANVP
jgi:hypothetical protein